MALAAGLDVELPMTDCYGAPLRRRRRRRNRRRRDPRPRRRAGAADQVRARPVRVPLRRRRRRPPRSSAPRRVVEFARSLASREHRAAPQRRNAADRPATTATIAVIGPNADDPRNLFGDYSYAAHVESLLEMRDADNVFHVPIPDDFDLDVDIVGERTVFGRSAAAFPTATVRTTPGCSVNGDDRDRLRRRGPPGRRVRSRRDGDGRQGGPHGRFDVRREPGSRVARPPGRAGGAPAGRPRDRDAGGAGARRRPPVRQRGGARTKRAPSSRAWLPGDEGAAAIADVLSGAVNPGGKLPVTFPRTAGHIPVYYRQKRSGGRSHWKGDYVDARSQPAVSLRPRPVVHVVRADDVESHTGDHRPRWRGHRSR